MKKYILTLIGALALCSFKPGSPAASGGSPQIHWMSWEQVQEAQKKNPKKVFVDVYTDWCGWCKRMDADTYENPVIVKYLTDNFYCIKFNAETHDDIMFKGQKYSTDGRYNTLATFLMQNRMSFPTIIYMDEELNLINIVPGYMNAKSIEPVLSFHATNSFKTTPWEEYQKNFKSSL
jgi:thioredoxin-related protein